MPTYLCHGFRWQRRSIRVFVVVQNLDDASPEWIIPAKSSQCILESFYNIFDFLPYHVPPSRSSGGYSDGDTTTTTLSHTNNRTGRSRSHSAASQSQRSRSQSRTGRQHSAARKETLPPLPNTFPSTRDNNNYNDDDLTTQDWSVVKLLEEYDPLNLTEVSRPHAYVADYVKRIDLSCSISEEIQRYEELLRADRDPPMKISSSSSKKTGGGGGWFEKMRDQLQRGEEIRWYVVVNGDEVRDWPDEPERRAADMSGGKRRPTPTREQKQHHAQYTMQQQIFREGDRFKGEGTAGGLDLVRPAVPEKDGPPLTRLRTDGGGGGNLKGGKDSSGGKGGGFRRLFGRGGNRGEESYYSP